MIVLALVLLIIVLVFSLAITLSNPDVYQLSLFRVLVPVTSAGVFFTGFGAALVTITALLLLRTGIRRSRETRRRLRSIDKPAASSASDSTGDRPEADRPADRNSGHADLEPPPPERPTSSSLDLDPGEDRTTAPVERRNAGAAPDDRDDPRT
jgi:hypothetical protein